MKDIRALFGILGKWKWHYASAAGLLLLSTFFRMLSPKVLQIAVDSISLLTGATVQVNSDPVAQIFYNILPALQEQNFANFLLLLGLLYLIISLVRALSAFASKALAANSSEKAIQGLRVRLFNHLQALPVAYHRSANTGEMIQRSTGDISTVRAFIMEQVVELVRMFGIFIASFYLMFIVHPMYALLAIALVPFITLSSYLFFQKETKVWEEHEDEADKLTNMVSENLSGIRVVKAFAQEAQEIERFKIRNTEKMKMGLKQLRLHALFWPLADYLVHMQLTLSVVVGGYFVLNGQITLGELTSFYIYALMVTWPMQRLGRILSQMGMAKVAMQRISSILDAEKEDEEGQRLTTPLLGKIEFQEVSFAYPSDPNHLVLDKVSFVINAGEQLGIIGPAGSGKSSLIQLLLRFYEPSNGRILIDDIDISTLHKEDLRKAIGAAMQSSFLFSTTIEGNIAYRKEDFSPTVLIEKAKAAQIDQVIDVFSDGYQTFVGEKGVSLSGGQKQRIALARALLSEPEILILDTATSAVDTETEHAIQMALKAQMNDKTRIVVAHRISSIQFADKILVLENGKLGQFGSPSELAKIEGFYSQMLAVQTDLEALIKADTVAE